MVVQRVRKVFYRLDECILLLLLLQQEERQGNLLSEHLLSRRFEKTVCRRNNGGERTLARLTTDARLLRGFPWPTHQGRASVCLSIYRSVCSTVRSIFKRAGFKALPRGRGHTQDSKDRYPVTAMPHTTRAPPCGYRRKLRLDIIIDNTIVLVSYPLLVSPSLCLSRCNHQRCNNLSFLLPWESRKAPSSDCWWVLLIILF